MLNMDPGSTNTAITTLKTNKITCMPLMTALECKLILIEINNYCNHIKLDSRYSLLEIFRASVSKF